MKNYIMLGTDGRITIPADIRRKLNMNYGDKIFVEASVDCGISIQLEKESCTFCGKPASSKRELKRVKKTLVCHKCAKELMKKLDRFAEEV